MKITEIQRGLFPGRNRFAPEKCYLRKAGGYFDETSGSFVFFRGMEFNTLTFYNAFSVAKWRRYTSVDSLYARLRGKGNVILRLMHAMRGNTEIVLSETHVELSPDGINEIEIPDFREIQAGHIYLNIVPLADGYLDYFGFATASEPGQAVRLGLVITHFNRQEQVRSAVSRIQSELLADEEYRGNISLVVVDNSCNSGVASSDCVRVIENENFGGAGGFSRGLLSLCEDGSYSHCLFMDDDASCEIESLRRAYKIMMFSSRDRTAIAGGLMQSDAPGMILEKGAYFDGICHRLHPHLLVTSEDGLIEAEEEYEKANYGGWWFFGFRIADVTYFPFPFFVRGDDTTFSLVNKFQILTMNGICSYGESFESKNSVMPSYLDARGHLVKQMAVLDQGLLRVLKGMCRFYFMTLLSHNYGSARAVTLAVEDVSGGTAFFLDNMDMQSRFPVIKQFSPLDAVRECRLEDIDIVYPDLASIEEGVLRKLFRFISLNGALLPGFMLNDATIFQHKKFRASFREIFRYRNVYYHCDPVSGGYISRFDRKEFFRSLANFTWTAARFALRFNAIKAEYRANMPAIMSRNFWQSRYAGEGTGRRRVNRSPRRI